MHGHAGSLVRSLARPLRSGTRPFTRFSSTASASPPSPLHLVLLGAPGAGKGTQTESLLKKYDLQSLVVGDLLREQVAQKSDVGLRAAKVMKAGGLLDDKTILDVVKPGIKLMDGTDWILVRS